MKRVLAATLLAFLVSASSAEAQGVRITITPPALRVEVRPAALSVGPVWIGGQDAVPPATGRVFDEARGANEGGQWGFYKGSWK